MPPQRKTPSNHMHPIHTFHSKERLAYTHATERLHQITCIQYTCASTTCGKKADGIRFETNEDQIETNITTKGNNYKTHTLDSLMQSEKKPPEEPRGWTPAAAPDCATVPFKNGSSAAVLATFCCEYYKKTNNKVK